MTIKLGHRISEVKFERRVLHVRKLGFWCKRINITEGPNILLNQDTVGFWQNTLEVRIGDKIYLGKAKHASTLRVVYGTNEKNEIVTYRKNTWKWRSPAEFSINPTAAPPNDILLLFITGYFTLRKLQQDNDGAVAAIVAAS